MIETNNFLVSENAEGFYGTSHNMLDASQTVLFRHDSLTPNNVQEYGRNTILPPNCNLAAFLTHWDRSTVEVAGHFLHSSLKEVQTVFGFTTSIWIECKIVQVGFKESQDYIETSSADEVHTNEGSGKSLLSKGIRPKIFLTNVSKQQILHVLVASPFDDSQYITVSCNDAFLPGTVLSTTSFYGKEDSLDRLSCGDEVEVFRTTPCPAWYPGFVRHVGIINGSRQAELQVLTFDSDHHFCFVHQLTSDASWRLASGPRLCLTATGGIFSEVLKFSSILNHKPDHEEINDILSMVKAKTHVLKAQSLANLKPFHFLLIGFAIDLIEAKTLFVDLLNSQPTSSVEGRRQRRLQFLAARRDGYQNPRAIEFLIKDAYVGSVIGRRGEKLSQVAKEFQIELRVLPEENGFRRVRIYGKEMKDVYQAKEALELVYQKILLSEGGLSKLKSHMTALKLMSQRANLLFCVLNEREKMLILCGVRRSLKIFRDRLRKIFSGGIPLQLQANHPNPGL